MLWCLVVCGAVLLVGTWVLLGGLLCGVWWLLPLWGCACGEWMACGSDCCAVSRWCGGCRLLCRGLASRGGRHCARGVAVGLVLVCGLVGMSAFGCSGAPGGGWWCTHRSRMLVVVWLDVLIRGPGWRRWGSSYWCVMGFGLGFFGAFLFGLVGSVWLGFSGVRWLCVPVCLLTILAGGWYRWLLAACSGSTGESCCSCVGLAAVSLGMGSPLPCCGAGWWFRSPPFPA